MLYHTTINIKTKNIFELSIIKIYKYYYDNIYVRNKSMDL